MSSVLDRNQRVVRREFPNADWMEFAADGIYADGRQISRGDSPEKAWQEAAWAVKLGHARAFRP